MISGSEQHRNLVAAYEVYMITSVAVVHCRIVYGIKSSE